MMGLAPESYAIRMDVAPEMVWVDLETCGLLPEDRVLEIGIQVTNRHGDERSTFQSVVGYADFVLSDFTELGPRGLSPVVHEMHTKNGLLDEVREASIITANQPRAGFARVDVETRAIDFLTMNFGYLDVGLPMAGASVQFDRGVLNVQMRRLHNWFHYRQYDVSTLLQLGDMTGNTPDESVQRRGFHRSVPDIEDEISVHRWAMQRLVTQV
ncbi:hypothetical protein AB0F25_30640 [Streptomyces wedmorensis]|uniref:hypothetical protein n=1 Tax=Streptomyces wedmorensis TaxID=43759 RepID=UPI003438D5FD